MEDAESAIGCRSGGPTHGEGRIMTKRARHWSLARVVSKRPSAAAVWLALCDMATARGSPVVTPTRAQLHKMTGKNKKTVSAALTTLEEAGWIERFHVPVSKAGKRSATLLRIVLRHKGGPAPRTANQKTVRCRGRSATPTGQSVKRPRQGDKRSGRSAPHTVQDAVEGVQRPKDKGRSTPQDFPSERGGGPPSSPPTLRCGGAEGTPLQAQGLVEGVDQHVHLPSQTAARKIVAGVGGPADGRQTADTIDEIIAMIGTESPGDPDEPSAPTDGRTAANAGNGGD